MALAPGGSTKAGEAVRWTVSPSLLTVAEGERDEQRATIHGSLSVHLLHPYSEFGGQAERVHAPRPANLDGLRGKGHLTHSKKWPGPY